MSISLLYIFFFFSKSLAFCVSSSSLYIETSEFILASWQKLGEEIGGRNGQSWRRKQRQRRVKRWSRGCIRRQRGRWFINCSTPPQLFTPLSTSSSSSTHIQASKQRLSGHGHAGVDSYLANSPRTGGSLKTYLLIQFMYYSWFLAKSSLTMSRDRSTGHVWMQIDDWRLYYSRFASFHCMDGGAGIFLSFFCLSSSRMIIQQTICHCRSYSTVVRASPGGCIMWSSFRILIFLFYSSTTHHFELNWKLSSLVDSRSTFRHIVHRPRLSYPTLAGSLHWKQCILQMRQ